MAEIVSLLRPPPSHVGTSPQRDPHTVSLSVHRLHMQTCAHLLRSYTTDASVYWGGLARLTGKPTDQMERSLYSSIEHEHCSAIDSQVPFKVRQAACVHAMHACTHGGTHIYSSAGPFRGVWGGMCLPLANHRHAGSPRGTRALTAMLAARAVPVH